MPRLGQLVARLRTSRGLSQGELSDLAGCDRDTIAKVEQGRGRWYPRNARAVYEALNTIAALSPQEASDYFELTGLTPAFANAGGPPPPPPVRLSPEISHAVSVLVDIVGEERALTAVWAINGLFAPPSPQGSRRGRSP